MATGSISFTASVEDLHLKEVEISCRHPSVKRVLLRSQEDEKLHIDFELINVFSKTDALSIVNDFVGPIVSRISYELNCPIGEPRCTGASLPTDSSGSWYRVAGSLILMNDIVSATVKPGKTHRENLKQRLELPLSKTDLYLELYRFCLTQKDPLARFLSLYHLLAVLFRDNQDRVDSAILGVNSATEVTLSPFKKGKRETVYTRLRNEIVHNRDGKHLQETKIEVKTKVDDFQEIIRKLIADRMKEEKSALTR